MVEATGARGSGIATVVPRAATLVEGATTGIVGVMTAEAVISSKIGGDRAMMENVAILIETARETETTCGRWSVRLARRVLHHRASRRSRRRISQMSFRF